MVIDFHTHVFPEKIAAATVSALHEKSGTPPHSDGTVAGLLSALESAGADIAVNLPVLTKPSQFESILKFASGLNAQPYSGRRIISFAGIHPDDEDYYDRLAMIRDAGILGIKIHPDYQNTFIDSPAYVRIFERAKELGLIIVTHAGEDAAYVGQPVKCTPARVLRLLDKIGGYDKFVLAHLGGNKMTADVIELLAGEKVYFDTSFSLHDAQKADFLTMVEKHGADRILFATDSPWRDIGEELEIFRSYNLGAETEEKILSANARKLLGL